MAKINEIIVSIESRLESCQARIDSVGRDVSSLAGDVRIVLDWILQRFGNEDESWNLRERIRQMSTVDAVNTSSSSSCVTSSRDSSGNIVIEISNNNLQAVPTVKQECVVFDTSTSSDFVENHMEDHVEELYHSDRSSNDENRAEDGQNVPTDVNDSFTEPAATSTPNTSSVGTRRGRPNRQASQQNKEPQATQCDQCGKILKDSSSLRQHKATHKDVRPFVCSECGKAFRRKFHLKTHTLIHTGEKKHQCGYCGKLFLLPKDLVAHERIHTGERPYSCHLCPKSFNLKSHLKMHVRTHTGEKPYQCDICKKSFSQSNSLRVHKKVHLRQQTTAARNPAAQPVDIPNAVVASSSSSIVIVTEEVGDNGAEGVLPIRLVHVSSAESSMTDA